MRRLGLIVCAVVGTVAAWNARHDLNPDGLSFLDIADALQRGEWSAALNAYWNPLYPSLLALLARPATIGPAWEFAAAHALNLAIYLGALASFDALMRAMLRASPDASLPRGPFLLVGYAAFLWATVGLIRLDVITPDLLMMLCLNAAFLCLLGARRVAGGVMLGLGYLAKTVMLPVTGLFLLSLFKRKTVTPIAVGFLVVATPFITALSIDRGRVTAGDSGRLNFAWKVGGMTSYFFPPASEAAKLTHPPRVICTSPTAYEFAGMPVTYPPWYDPSYWYEGITPRFTWRAQGEVFVNGARTAYVMLRQAWPLAALLFVLFVLAPVGRRFRPLTPEVRAIGLTCLLALAMYATVEFSVRLAAPFIPPLVLVALLLPAQASRLVRATHALSITTAAVLAAIVVQPVIARAVGEVSAINKGVPTHEHLEIAREIIRAGLEPGDRLAVIGEGYGAYWARLARGRIVAEAPNPAEFWQAPPDDRRACFEQFRSTGARMLVTFRAKRTDEAAWQPLGATNYDYLRLAVSPPNPSRKNAR